MKKVLSIVLTLAVLICSLCVSASAKTDEYDFLGEIAIYGTSMIIGQNDGDIALYKYRTNPEPILWYGYGRGGATRDFDEDNMYTDMYMNNMAAWEATDKFRGVGIDDTITYLGANLLTVFPNLDYVIISDSVTEINDKCFPDYKESILVLCNKDSCAHQFAIENGMPYMLLDYNSGLIGDVTNDGNVNGKDLLQLRRYIAGIDSDWAICFDLSDVNSDGKINGKDTLLLRKALVGLITL